jgi:hypothetical protein
MVKCEECGTEYDEDASCPKCAQDWDEMMRCEECKKEFAHHKRSEHGIEEEYLRYTIETEIGMWDDWDHNDDLAHFCSLQCMAKWISEKTTKPTKPIKPTKPTKSTFKNTQKGLFFTKCIYDGQKTRKNQAHLAQNRFGVWAYYCDHCLQKHS